MDTWNGEKSFTDMTYDERVDSEIILDTYQVHGKMELPIEGKK